jgi:hypothetical protein
MRSLASPSDLIWHAQSLADGSDGNPGLLVTLQPERSPTPDRE